MGLTVGVLWVIIHPSNQRTAGNQNMKNLILTIILAAGVAGMDSGYRKDFSADLAPVSITAVK